jgi:ABC-type phosphate transport system substrate-binding protein
MERPAATRERSPAVPALARVLLACATLSACGKTTETTDAATGASVTGTLTLAAPVTAGASWFVRLATSPAGVTTPVAEATGTTTASASIDYQIAGVPAGTYFVLGFVDVDASGGTASTPGDYAGWYGHNGDGNPPAAANAAVPATGTVSFDFSLVLR